MLICFMVIFAVCDYPESSVFAQQELSNMEKIRPLKIESRYKRDSISRAIPQDSGIGQKPFCPLGRRAWMP